MSYLHIRDGLYPAAANDLAGMNKMEAKQTHCQCGRYIGHKRLDMGLNNCTYCSMDEMRKQGMQQTLLRRGLDLDKANKIAYSKLTSYLVTR